MRRHSKGRFIDVLEAFRLLLMKNNCVLLFGRIKVESVEMVCFGTLRQSVKLSSKPHKHYIFGRRRTVKRAARSSMQFQVVSKELTKAGSR